MVKECVRRGPAPRKEGMRGDKLPEPVGKEIRPDSAAGLGILYTSAEISRPILWRWHAGTQVVTNRLSADAEGLLALEGSLRISQEILYRATAFLTLRIFLQEVLPTRLIPSCCPWALGFEH
jgi:hypothetical protein